MKNLKKYLEPILTIIIPFLFFYLCISFVNLTFDFTLWSIITRTFFIIFSIIGMFIINLSQLTK